MKSTEQGQIKINYPLIERIISDNNISKTRFMEYVFGEGNANGVAKRLEGKNPPLNTCCRIADYLHLSLDSLRDDSPAPATGFISRNSGNNVGNTYNNTGNVTISDDAAREISYLKSEIENLKEMVSAKDQTIAKQEETISVLKLLVNQVQISKDETTSLYELHQSSANSNQMSNINQ